MAFLIIKEGENKGAAFELKDDITSIGRNKDNNIAISDSSISRYHAKIIHRNNNHYITDLKSAHGTIINDNKISDETLINENDIIQIGNIEFIYSKDIRNASLYVKKNNEADEKQEKKNITDTILVNDKSGKHLADKHWEMLTKIADATLSVFKLDELLDKLMDMLFEVFKPDRGAILLYDKEGIKLKPRVQMPKNTDFKISQTILNHAIEKKVSFLASDILDDNRFSEAQSVVANSISSVICSPLVRNERVFGVIYLDAITRQLVYQKGDLALLNIVSAYSAISIENALLVSEKVNTERLAAVGVAISGISHNIKNLTMGILGPIDVIEKEMEKGNINSLRSLWSIISRSLKKISEIVQDMLTYSKAREPNWQEGNINKIIKDIYENQKERAVKNNVEIKLELNENLCNSDFDHKRISDSLLNIVGNAIEACEDLDNSVVTLKTDIIKNQIYIEISDNGIGIPEDVQPKIFEPFFSTKGSQGTGLGLPIAKKTIEEHNGKLTIQSEEDVGTTFKIFLPVKATPKKQEQ